MQILTADRLQITDGFPLQPIEYQRRVGIYIYCLPSILQMLHQRSFRETKRGDGLFREPGTVDHFQQVHKSTLPRASELTEVGLALHRCICTFKFKHYITVLENSSDRKKCVGWMSGQKKQGSFSLVKTRWDQIILDWSSEGNVGCSRSPKTE